MDDLISTQQIMAQSGRSRSAVSQAQHRYRWQLVFRSVFKADAGLPGRTPRDYVRAAVAANNAGQPRLLFWDK